MGCPSVYCEYVLLPLANKEATLGLWQDRIKPDWKSEQRYREKIEGIKEMPYICQRRKMPELYPVSHNLVAIHRIIKMG